MALLPSEMTCSQFVQTFHVIYHNVDNSTHSIPTAAYPALTKSHDTPANLHKLLSEAFRNVPESQLVARLNGYPRLAGKALLSKHSSEEQASRGLDRLPDDIQNEFDRLNDRYEARFGFPFIIPVKDNTLREIVDAMRNRLERTRDEEFEEACRSVDRIAEIRVFEWFNENHPAVSRDHP